MPELAAVPDSLLRITAELKLYLAVSLKYVAALKPKPSSAEGAIHPEGSIRISETHRTPNRRENSLMRRFLWLSLLLCTVPAWGQDRFQSGEFQGFTKSPVEGIIVRVEQPFVVDGVKGIVLRSVGDRSPLDRVLFELRGPDASGTIRSARSGSDGHFHIRSVPPGRYVFKATAIGFQSVTGVVLVFSKAMPGKGIRLEMKPGV